MSIPILIMCFSLAFAVTFASTPVVKRLAYKIGAVDVPKDTRRMHKIPTPRLGGLAIFYGFLISVLFFANVNNSVRGLLVGCLLIVGVGIIDDSVQLKAIVKLPVQIIAAIVIVAHDTQITALSVPNFISESGIIALGNLSIPITVLWIVGVTNAVNLIDGLDGLAVGVSSIATFSLAFIAILSGEPNVAVISASLAGACLGFLPYNFNPAKMFMGDTGATLLGFVLSVICIQGLFKAYAVISFVVPFLILGLPIFDTTFAILRRIKNHQPIMGADRGHLHHRLIDMGFSQKQTVAILYIISTLLGITAVVVIEEGADQAIWIVASVLMFIFFSAKLSAQKYRNSQFKEVSSKNENVNIEFKNIEIEKEEQTHKPTQDDTQE